MNTHEKQLLSVCCEVKTYYIPACFGDPEMYICKKCNKHCDTKVVEVEIFKQIAKGVYRPIKNI